MLLANLLAAAFVLLAPIADLVAPTTTPSLPWTAGQKLVYRGTVRYLDTSRCKDGVCEEATAPIQWTILVRETEERDGYRLYHLSGFFRELLWIKDKPPAPKPWIVVVTPSGDVLYAEEPRKAKSLRMKSLVSRGERFFKLPPMEGDPFDCDRPRTKGKKDCHYCRCILPASPGRESWVSKWWDNTGEDAYFYDEKRGFVRFKWEHHGTPSAVDISLVTDPPAQP